MCMQPEAARPVTCGSSFGECTPETSSHTGPPHSASVALVDVYARSTLNRNVRPCQQHVPPKGSGSLCGIDQIRSRSSCPPTRRRSMTRCERAAAAAGMPGCSSVGSVSALIAVAHDPAVAEDESAVAARGDARIVGGDEQREAMFGSQSVEYGDNLGAGMGIQVAGRLVGQYDARMIDERAGDRHALLLAAGQLRR